MRRALSEAPHCAGSRLAGKEQAVTTESESVSRLREIVREVGFSFHADHTVEDWVYMGLAEDRAKEILSVCDAVEQEGLDPNAIALDELGQTEENEERDTDDD